MSRFWPKATTNHWEQSLLPSVFAEAPVEQKRKICISPFENHQTKSHVIKRMYSKVPVRNFYYVSLFEDARWRNKSHLLQALNNAPVAGTLSYVDVAFARFAGVGGGALSKRKCERVSFSKVDLCATLLFWDHQYISMKKSVQFAGKQKAWITFWAQL